MTGWRQERSRAYRRKSDLVLCEPIFASQAIYTTELRKIAGYYRESTASSVAGDQQIVAANWHTLSLQARADISGVVGSGLVERQHVKAGGEALHLVSIVLRPRRFCRTVEEFGEHNRGDAETVSFEIEPFPNFPRPIAQHPDAKVRVEQEAKHQNPSRVCTTG